MMNLFKKRRGLAIAMVAILVLTLLPVDLNWADDASMIQELRMSEEDTENGTEESTINVEGTVEDDSQDTSNESTTDAGILEETTQEIITSEVASSETMPTEQSTELIESNESTSENASLEISSVEENATEDETAKNVVTDNTVEENTFTEDKTAEETTTEVETDAPLLEESEIERQMADASSTSDLFTGTTIDLSSLDLEASYKDENNITQVVDMTTTEGVELPVDADILMNFNFLMADGNSVDCSKSYVYNIPDNIRVDVNATHELENANGESIGQVVISSDGTMTFTFYENMIKNQQSIPFYVTFEGGFSADVQENKGETALSFPTASGEFTYNVDVQDSYQTEEDKEPGDIATYKSGTQLVGADGKNYIRWTIGIDPNGRDVYSADVVDNIPTGLTYVEGSAELSVQDEDHSNPGSVTETVNGSRVTFHIKDSNPYYHTKLTFLTEYDQSLFGDQITNGEVALVNNTVAVNPSDGTTPAEGSTEVKVTPNVLSKSGASYDSNSNSITWTVTINSDGFDLGNAVYTDTFGAGLTLDGSVNMVPAGSGTVNITGTGFTFTPNSGASDKIVLTYKTTVQDAYLQADKFTNEGTLIGDDYNVSDNATVQGVDWISKTGNSYNDVTKQFTWTIVVNESGLNLTNATVQDIFNTNNMTLVSMTVTDEAGVEDNTAVVSGDTVTFPTLDDKRYITVITRLNEEDFEVPNWQLNESQYLIDGRYYSVNNKAILTVDAKSFDAEANYNFQYKKPDLLYKSGALTGEGTIRWMLECKYQNLTQDKIVITDTLPSDMEYVQGTFRLQYYNSVWDTSQYVYVTPTVVNGVLSYTLEKDALSDSYYMNNTFYVTYETKLKDANMEQADKPSAYTNSAKLEVTYEGGVVVDDTATATVNGTIGGVLGKEYAYTSSNDYVDWTVTINEAGYDMSEVNNPIIKDKLDDYFDYVSGTLYKITGGTRVEVPASDYVVVVVNNMITVKLPNIGTDTFEFVFRTKFNISAAKLEGMTIKNTVDFIGEGVNQSVVSDEVKNVSFSSSSAGSRIEKELRIRKVDANTKQALEGAEFILYYKGVECETLTTDENGWATFSITSALDGYTYELVESQAPNGYQKIDGSKEITIKDTELKTDTATGVRYIEYVIENVPLVTTAAINLYKTDDNAKALPGAEFGLYSDADCTTLVARRTTDDNGMAIFSVETGNGDTTYYIKEISAPDGYILDTTTVKEVKVTSDGIVTYGSSGTDYVVVNNTNAFSFENKKAYATLKLKKIQAYATPEVLISGAKFGLYADANCVDLIETKTTDANGLITFTTELEPGTTYYYRELEAPVGYVLDNTIHSVTIGDGTEHKNIETTVTVENTEALGSIKITKTDDSIPANMLTGVSFTLYDEDGMTPVLREGNPYSVTTDSNGVAVFDKLPFGTYVVREDDAPEGYVIASTDTAVVVNSIFGTELNIVNEQIKIHVKITKKDDSNNPLEGVVFAIYKKNSGALVKSGTTDENGELEFDNIPYGDYEVRETKGLDGYIQSTDTLEIAKNNITTNGQVFTWDVENIKENANITFKKKTVNENNVVNYLAGAEFTIYDSMGRVVKKADGSDYVAVSDSNGVLTFSGLPFDTYTIKETKAPTDYKLDNTVWYVDVTQNTTYTQLYTVLSDTSTGLSEINNDKLDVGIIYVSFSLKKVDSDAKPLQGAQFEFSKINPGDSDWIVLSTAYSDANGVVPFYNITVEHDNENTKYRIQEVSAPTGYKLDSETCTKEYTYKELTQMQISGKDMVGHDKKKEVFTNVPLIETFENERILGKIRVTKTGVLSSQKLQGAEFVLYKKDGTTPYPDATNPYTATTDENGIAMFENLPVGDYVVREKGAPNGYTLNTLYRPSVAILDEATKDVVFSDTPITVYVNKRANGSSQQLAGAILAIYDGDTQLEKWTTTTQQHKLNASNLEVGKTYTLKELQAPDGYVIAQEVQFTIQNDGTVIYVSGGGSASGQNVNMIDDAINLNVRKVDSAFNGLSGALLTVIDDATGVSVYDFTSDGNAHNIPSNKLVAPSKAGEYTYYTIREKSAPAGYQLADDIRIAIDYKGNIYLVNGTNMTPATTPIVMVDEMKHDFYFAKVDAATGQRLAGAELEIVNANTQVCEESWTSGTSPQNITLSDGETYIFREVAAPNGYIKADPITFKVSGTTLSIVSGNASDLSYDKITITMRDEALNVKVRKLTESSAILPGATFELYESNVDNEKVKLLETFVTADASTVLNNKNLKTEMWYALVETDAPQGYELAEPVYFYIDADGVAKNIHGEEYDSNLIEIKDVEKQLSVQKIDANTELPLAGVTLCITSSEDTDFEAVQWTADGTAKYFNYSTFKYDTKYLLTEIQTINGYTYADSIEFYINGADEQVYVDEVVTTAGRVTMKNITFEIKVDKKDLDTKTTLEGATLVVKDNNGNVLEQWVTDGGVHKLDTSKLMVSTNDENVYTLEELAAPELYALAQPIQFVITTDGTLKRLDGESVTDNTLVMYDEYRGMTFNKIDSNGNALSGATITISSTEDTTFTPITFVTTTTPKNLNIDLFKADVEYVITEVVAPNGYTYAPDITFKFDDEGVLYINGVETKDRSITMTDASFAVKIVKKIAGTDTMLPGATLSIVDEANGTVIYSWKTDGTEFTVPTTNLTASTDSKIIYVLKENQAPENYKLALDIRFYINRDGQVYIINNDGTETLAVGNIITMYDEEEIEEKEEEEKEEEDEEEKEKEEDDDDSITSSSKKTGDSAPLKGIIGLLLFAMAGLVICIGYKNKLNE